MVAYIIGFSNSFYQEISNLIEGETGIPQEYIMLCATHTHSGPVCGVYNQNISPEIRAYVNDLRTKLLGATKMAICNLEPATIGVGKGICKMNINRRGRNVKGEMMIRRNPYGSIDNEVAVVKINGLNGDPMAIFINWPCHGTSIGSRNYLISGDWPGAAARFVEKEFNNKIIAPVTAGASGDINPIYAVNDFNTKIGESEIIGKILGEESIRVLKNLSISPLGTVKGSQRLISLPEKKRGEMNELNYEPTGDDVIIRLSVLKINTIVFVGISGELVHEIGLEIKELSPFKQTIVVTHCNGSSGYFATDKHYTEGGYEVRTSRLMPGAESAIIENLMEMIRQL
jgi:neutral ceramidase